MPGKELVIAERAEKNILKDYRRGLSFNEISLKYRVSPSFIYNRIKMANVTRDTDVRPAPVPKTFRYEKFKFEGDFTFLYLVGDVWDIFVRDKGSIDDWIKLRGPYHLDLVKRLKSFFSEVRRFKTVEERFDYVLSVFPGMINILDIYLIEEYLHHPNALDIAKQRKVPYRRMLGLLKITGLAGWVNRKDYWRDQILTLYRRNRNIHGTARTLNLTEDFVREVLLFEKIPLISYQQMPGFLAEKYKDKILRMYRSGIPLTRIGPELGISHQTLWVKLREWNEPIKDYQKKLPPDEKLLRLFKEGLTVSDISGMYGVHVAAIYRKLKSLGVNFKKLPPSIDDLKYWYQRLTVPQLARFLNKTEDEVKEMLRVIPDLDKLERKVHYDKALRRADVEIARELFSKGANNLTVMRVLQRSAAQIYRIKDALGISRKFEILSPEVKSEIIRLYQSGMKPMEIAAKLHILRSKIDHVVAKAGVRRHWGYTADEKEKQKSFISEGIIKHKGVRQLARELGVNTETINSRMNEMGIKRMYAGKFYSADDWFARVRRTAYLYLVRNKSLEEIAKSFGMVGGKTRLVRRWINDIDKVYSFQISYYKKRDGHYEPVRTGTFSTLGNLMGAKKLLTTGFGSESIRDLRVWLVKKAGISEYRMSRNTQFFST